MMSTERWRVSTEYVEWSKQMPSISSLEKEIVLCNLTYRSDEHYRSDSSDDYFKAVSADCREKVISLVLESLLNVDLKIVEGFKYVVIATAQETVVYGSEDSRSHKGLVEEFRKKHSICWFSLICLGGGHISKDESEKTIHLSRDSTAFGREPNREQVVAAIQRAYPDYKVTCSD